MWEQTGKTLVSQIAGQGAPALVFWAWAITVWFVGHDRWNDLAGVLDVLATGTSGAALLVLVGVVTVVTASGVVISRFATSILRCLEGYWPSWASRFAQRRKNHWRQIVDEMEQANARLTSVESDTAAIASLEQQLRRFPAARDVLPTRIGNIIRAGERRPLYWYGLDPIVVWPQLWLVLADQPRIVMAVARARLDRSIVAFLWAALSIALGLWWWPAFLVGVLVTALAWRYWIPAAADNYATLLAAVFDTHRFVLYAALHLALPTDPATEPKHGQDLTDYLWNRTAHPHHFHHPATNQPPTSHQRVD